GETPGMGIGPISMPLLLMVWFLVMSLPL
ncbi:hypothetical protein A2U01_0095327, partial [Trifolium medium]|nr:hypothetical protein [Trifolium medium]